MLSALEAAYSWEDDVQLLVIKDLNSGQVHWAVQAIAPSKPSSSVRRESDDAGEEDDEPPMELPRAFSRNGGGAELPPELGGPLDGTGADGEACGTVLPFLLHNLDTGEQTVIDEAWSQYTDDMATRAKAAAGPLQARPSAGTDMPSLSPKRSPERDQCSSDGPAQGQPASGAAGGGGSFWMQSVQRQAVRRLGQV